jgi:2-amino-4-hydroxy-6-hydroxymethyldihydropteridine diphosphokinase
VVGFGANLGDRLRTMRAAAHELGRTARVERGSRVFVTAPVGGPPQPDYLNAAALVRYEGEPEALLGALLAIEERLGRRRGGERFGPRAIDLDILWIEGEAVDTEVLVVPHPRLLERAFALVPLLELVPEARDPRTGRLLAESPLAQGAQSESVIRPTSDALLSAP